MKKTLVFLLIIIPSFVCMAFGQDEKIKRLPIIDMHMHMYQWNRYGDPPPPNFITRQIPDARTDIEVIKDYINEMEQYNIILAVGSAQIDMVKKWKDYAPEKFIAGLQFPRNTTPGKTKRTEWPDIRKLRELCKSGQVQILGEIIAQYAGIAANEPKLEPYFALAEELDIPVCFHTGFSEPMTPYTGDPDFRIRYNNPLLLEDVLVKHPKLRIYIAHGGYPFIEETIALMIMYQQVYMDVSAINWILPRKEFHDYLQRLIQLWIGKRIMFGSDQMIWPDAVGRGIEAVESATFLSEEQKRDIFYNNAVRFLRLKKQL